MKKRIISVIFVLVTVLSLFPSAALAANTEQEALGEVNIYNGGEKLSYLSINGRVRELIYTYYNFVRKDGSAKEVPAYCVNPNIKGVPQTVAKGESIKYMAKEKSSDPKIMGIVANGYPNRGLEELNLENKYQAYYATKMALWCYILPNWDIANLKVNPNLTGMELTRAKAILAAAKSIYTRGTAWSSVLSPSVSCTPDKKTAYLVTVDGKEYFQQVFTFSSKTWICNYAVEVAFSDPDSIPSGTRIVNMDNQDITTITTSANGNGYNGKFKVLYPKDSVAGKSGSNQLTFKTNVYQYAIFYAVCAEVGRYGTLQNYMVDTDPTTSMQLSAYSSYSDSQEEEPETGLKIIKYETGTTIPLEGARFEVIGPNGDTVGYFTSNSAGEVNIPLKIAGNYTVIERDAPENHLLSKNPTQNVTVVYNEVAKVTFFNDPYGSLCVQKMSNTGEYLQGATIQVKHIESGATYTQQTGSAGVAFFDQLKPGAYEVCETAGISGWLADTDTIQTINVVAGETSDATIINKELPGLRIIKYDRKTQEAMAGVTFEIFRDSISLGNYRTDQFGEILLTNAEPGTYRVVEVDNGSDGHILDTTPQEIELKIGDGIRELLFFNDQKPGIHLIKVDSADPSKVIPNAVFEIKSVKGDYGPKEFATNEEGEIDLSKLPEGSYVVTEKSCAGYVIDDAQRIIHLVPNETAQFVFTNSKLPTFRVVKESADGHVLGGVTFRLSKIVDGTRYMDRITDPTTGIAEWADLEPGVYSLKEVSTVSDHILDTREYHIQVFPGKDSTICLQNNKRPNLTIHKSDTDTGVPVEGAVFLVRTADGHSVAEVKTGPDGTVTVPNLLPLVYEIEEKSVPEPYLLDAPKQLITLFPNRDRDVYFENHQRPSIVIEKENSITHEPLSHVRFQVWFAAGNNSTGDYRDLGIFETDANGKIEIPGSAYGLKDGWFRVKELEPPTGFSIKDSDTQEAFIQGGKSHTFKFQNTPLSSLIVWKYDSKTGAAVPNCRFEVRYLGGETSGSGGTVIGQYTTSSNGSFCLTGLKSGYYIVEEVRSDDAHVIDSAPQTAYISGKKQDIVQLHFGNSSKGNILVKKVSSADGTPLSDVEFLVTKADGSVVGNANGKYVTDSSGSFNVENQEPGTTLVIKETRAKSGYLLDDTTITAVVKAGETVTVEVRNQPKGNLIIEKLDGSDKKTPLEGVRFKIIYADGSIVDDKEGKLSSNGIYYTGKNGQIILGNVTGTIIVTEEASIEGYTIDPNNRSQTVVVNPDDTQVLRFYNNPVGGVEIIKINEDDHSERIPNTTFEIRRLDDALVETVTTDKNGRAFASLEDGNYYAKEITANKSFRLDDTPHYFEIKDGKRVTLKVTNKALSGIIIHKVDSSTGDGIYGVKFVLYDANKRPIGEYTSDDRGYVYIDEIPDGLSGRFYLRELETASGYILDEQYKTIYVSPGKVAEIEWKNTAVTGQIQIWKKSADDNPINGFAAGTPLEGAVFEIYNKANKLVDTIKSNSRGLAVSKQLPLGRYTVKEVSAPPFYAISSETATAYLEHSGQIVQLEFLNKSVYTNVAIHKTGYAQVVPGQTMRYTFKEISNNSTVPLSNFYWRDTLPTDAVCLDKIITGTWSARLSYKIVYKTNLHSDYRVLADNLQTSRNNTISASPAALGLASNEYVTEVMFLFGQVTAGFTQLQTPYLYCTVKSSLTHEYRFTNKADVGGMWQNQWIMANDRWVTVVYRGGKVPTLPRTGY